MTAIETYAALEACLLAYPAALKEYPFGEEVAVFKVGGKMFALCSWREHPLRVNLKCPPEQADFFRGIFPAVTPGYHMNKRHWNTVTLDGSIPDEIVQEMLDTSYHLIADSLPRRVRQALGLSNPLPRAATSGKP
ncbi:MAG: MmcQ/YjbR family DNA-binding protein [Anaerolineales bacterium]